MTPQAIPPAPAMATADANPYGAIIIEPEWAANPPLPAAPLVAKLEGVPPASPTNSVPPPAAAETAPSAPSLPAETMPAPPTSGVANIADSAPLPPPRPPEFGPAAKPAERRAIQESVGSAPVPADNRNIFQKLFGLGQPSAPFTTSGAKAPETRVASAVPETRVASAAPEARAATAAPKFRFPGFSFFGGSGPVAGYDQWTAVYDISARTVYLPDGTKLEAHSGYGDKLDDPRYVNEPMRGATPPHLYELEPREASFHGVQALRLKPIGEGGIFGRAGLLAHSYMLGPNGEFERLRVVQELRGLPPRLRKRRDQAPRRRHQALRRLAQLRVQRASSVLSFSLAEPEADSRSDEPASENTPIGVARPARRRTSVNRRLWR